jgi:hypothetical protein
VTARDAAILDALVAFARAPGKRRWAAVPFAERVSLGLGPRLVARKTARELLDPRAWVLHARTFRAYGGPFSALELIADERRLVFRAGVHRHCVSPPVPPPRAVASRQRLSIQPRRFDSCLRWFTVDAFVTDSGEIEAITLDAWEP